MQCGFATAVPCALALARRHGRARDLPVRKSSTGLLAVALALTACAPSTSSAAPSHDRAYALDARDRSAPAGGEAKCTPDELVTYRGAAVRYAAPVQVHPSFTDRLERFERIASEVGVEVYGRAPSKLHHAGAYSCRTMPSGRYSEHAFGNALDLEGFSFSAAGKGKPAVRVRVADAWRDGGDAQAKRFFARLLERLDERDDVFRAIVGPPDPGHLDHLHLDMGPWSYSRYASPTAAWRS